MHYKAYYCHNEAYKSSKNVETTDHEATRAAERRRRREYEPFRTPERCNYVIYGMQKTTEMSKWGLLF